MLRLLLGLIHEMVSLNHHEMHGYIYLGLGGFCLYMLFHVFDHRFYLVSHYQLNLLLQQRGNHIRFWRLHGNGNFSCWLLNRFGFCLLCNFWLSPQGFRMKPLQVSSHQSQLFHNFILWRFLLCLLRSKIVHCSLLWLS